MKKIKNTIVITLMLIILSVAQPKRASAQTLPAPIINSLSALLVQAQSLLSDARFAPVAQNIIARVSDVLDGYLSELAVSSAFEDQDMFLALYTVENGELDHKDGEKDDVDFDMWDLFLKTSDHQIVNQYLSHFAVYEDSNSDLAAYVEKSSYGDDWILAVNLDGTSFDTNSEIFDNAEVLVHEFSHVLTLNTSQVDATISDELCLTHSIGEGCPKKDSYYQNFIDEFWSVRDLETVDSWLEYSQDEADELLQEWYEDHEDQFVTDYAATNPGEDIAESFTFFVFEDRPLESRISDQKIDFFYQFPELVVLRNNIRRELGDIIDYGTLR